MSEDTLTSSSGAVPAPMPPAGSPPPPQAAPIYTPPNHNANLEPPLQGKPLEPGVYIGTASAGPIPGVHNFIETVHEDGTHEVFEFGNRISGRLPHGEIEEQKYGNSITNSDYARIPPPAGVDPGNAGAVERWVTSVDHAAMGLSFVLKDSHLEYQTLGGQATEIAATMVRSEHSPMSGRDYGVQAAVNGNTAAAYILLSTGSTYADISHAFGSDRHEVLSLEKQMLSSSSARESDSVDARAHALNGTPQWSHQFPDVYEVTSPNAVWRDSIQRPLEYLKGDQTQSHLKLNSFNRGSVVAIDSRTVTQNLGRDTATYQLSDLRERSSDPDRLEADLRAAAQSKQIAEIKLDRDGVATLVVERDHALHRTQQR